MKKLFVAVSVMLIIASSAHAAKLFDYRGVFPAERAAEARITNYMLLKEATTIRFEIEEQGQNLSDRIRITQVKLTSDPTVLFSDQTGLKELVLPKTGIYEITLVPVVPPGSEIRFILKVMEVESKAAAIIGDSWKPDSAIGSGTAKIPAATVDAGKAVVPAIIATQPAVVEQNKIDINTTQIAPATATPEAGKAIELQVTAVPPTVTVIATQTVPLQPITEVASVAVIPVTDTDNKGLIILESPVTGVFLNPFNGFRFKIEDMELQKPEVLQKHLRVLLRNSDGTEKTVKGSVFSPEPDIFVFLPEKVIPGAVYTVEITDAALTQKKLQQVPVFPEISAEFVKLPEELKIRIFWQQNTSLIANPAGQMIALIGSKIMLTSAQKQILQLDAEQNLLPFGAVDRIAYRARPFELELSVPLDLVRENGCNLEVLAAVDGSSGMASAFRATWQESGPASGSQEDRDEDFSDYEAIYGDKVASEPLIEEPVEEIIPLTSLPDEAAFKIEKSFSLLESDADSALAWPQDLTWDDKGSVFILDSQRRRICKFSANGKLLKAFGEKGEGVGNLGLPVALAVKDGVVFVSDSAMHSIHRFSGNGDFLGMIKSDPVAGLLIDLPGGMSFRKDEMWVADRGSSRILCFNTQGGFLGSFGSTAAAPINAPISIRADAESLFILEKSGLVKKFSPMGRFDATFQTGCLEGLGFAADDWGGIWVCDAQKFQVLRFSRNGKLLTSIAAPQAPGTWLPTAVAVRADGKVAVTDAQNKMLHIFAPEK